MQEVLGHIIFRNNLIVVPRSSDQKVMLQLLGSLEKEVIQTVAAMEMKHASTKEQILQFDLLQILVDAPNTPFT